MSTLQVTTIQTANNTTNLTITTGSGTGSKMVLDTAGNIGIGNTTANTLTVNGSALAVTSNLIANSSGLYLGNATVNSVVSGSGLIVGNATVNAVHTSSGLTVGSNVTVNATGVYVGNATVNTVASAGSLSINGVTANGIGNTVGQIVQVATGGKLPVLDGSNLTGLSSTGLLVSINVYTSTQTITIPAGATQADIILGGPGGGGNGGSTTGGGGAGGTLRKYLTGLTPGNTLALTIGSGGGSSASGSSDSTLASGTQTISTLTARKGTSTASSNTGSAGGTATNGDINISGSNGSNYIGISCTPLSMGGNGGWPGFGLGTPGITYASSLSTGPSASGYCAGGAGVGTTSSGNGGTGGNGICIISWYK